MKILFLMPRFPLPLRRGHQVRAYHQIRLLSARHRITLVSVSFEDPAPEAISALAPFCEEIVPLRLSGTAAAANALRGAVAGVPFQASAYSGTRLRRTVRETIRRRLPDVLHVQLARMAPAAEPALGIPRVMDLVDSLSLNMERRFRRDRGPARWAAWVEWKAMARYERNIAATWDHTTVVSPVDRAAIGDHPRLTVNPNGVDLEQFAFSPDGREPATIAFTGNLGYFPNVDAVTWFSREILPEVRRRVPSALFLLAGTRPSAEVRALAGRNGLRLEQEVDRIEGVLSGATVAVAPMRAGSGQLLKILEAMASGVPVVATPVAAAAFDFAPGRELLVAEAPAEFASAVARLLEDPAEAKAIASRARRAVEERYGWERSVADLERIYASVAARSPSDR
jgi:sugar transferase (PEP-CTERM/EpsH1 system associated)